MSITVIMLHYKRPLKNLEVIVDSLLSKPDSDLREIVIFNNDPDVDLGHEFRGATVINAGRNFFIPIRHALALALESTHYLFIDDDIAISPRTLGIFREWADKLPEAILGLFGVRLAVGSEKLYTEGEHLNYKTRPRGLAEVDIVVGRVHFCRADKLAQAFQWRNRIPGTADKHRFVEDIVLSLANRFSGHRNFIIPLGSGVDFRELPPEGASSVCEMEGLWQGRNEIVLDMIRAYGEGYEDALGI